MAKFIKFTNVTPLKLQGGKEETVEETILSTDQITSVSEKGDNHYLGTKIIIFEHEGDNIKSFAPSVQQVIISKEDYENAKKILLEV